jgi:predicted outer membrane repeat protein
VRSRQKHASPRKRPTFRPALEALEERWVLSTLTVLNTHDSGAGSLRADIAAAHSGDTINFAPSLDGQTITLTKGELLINKNLTIAGPGAGALTVSGNNQSRVFEMAAGTQVALSGLTIDNGFAVNGAGILVDTGAVLAVSNSTLSGNSATTVSNCNLTNNTSLAGGGGIYNHATLTVNSNSTVSGSSDVGIANAGTATISGSTLSNNGGSGVYNFTSGTVTVSDSLLNANFAYGDGGGVYNAGAATITNCTLSGNSAPEYGGAIYSSSNFSGSGRLNVSGCTLSGNSSTHGSGGAVYITAGTATISGCTLSGNSAGSEGGGIFIVGGTATVANSTLTGNTAATTGGGIDVLGGTLTLDNSTLSGNTAAQEGGGIYNRSAGTVFVKNSSKITGNTAPAGFGADVYNLGVLDLDVSSMIGVLDGNPAVLI